MTSSSVQLWWILAVVGIGASCQRQEGAIAVDLTVPAEVKADCLKLSVYSAGQEQRWKVLPRVDGKTQWKIAIGRIPELPESVTLIASGWLGRCDDETSLKLNSRGTGVDVIFPSDGVEEVAMRLDAPPPEVDADRDGYRAVANGGSDCRDDDPLVHPGAAERCNLEVDTNCDGLVACADPQCATGASCGAPPDRLALLGLTPPLTAGACASPMRVELRDTLGPRAAPRTTVISLEGTQFFSSLDCSGPPVLSTQVAYQGTTSAGFSARFPTPGPVTLTAKADGLLPGSVSVDVQPVPIAALRLSHLPPTQPAGACGGPFLIELLDAKGMPTTTTLAQTVTLGAQPSEATGAFFSDAACAGPASAQLVIPPGQGTATFRFRGTHAGATSLSATAAGHTVSATLTVTPGAAAQLAFLSAPLALRTSDPCSSARNAVLRFEVEDAFGNRTTTPTAVVCAPAVSGNLSLTFFDAASGQCSTPVAGVTIGQGSSEAGFLVRANAVGSGTVTVTPLTGLRAVTQALTATAGDATKLAFTTGPQAPLAGECTAAEIVLEAQDAVGIPSSFAVDTTVNLATTTVSVEAPFHFYSQPGCPLTSVLTTTLLFPAGQSQVKLYFRGEKQATGFGIRASTGSTEATLAGNSVRAGPPASLTWPPPAPPSVKAGDCSASFTLRLQDAFQNPTVFASAQALQLTSTPGGLTFGTPTGCQSPSPLSFPPGASDVAVQARGTDAGTYQISATTAGVSTTVPTSLQVSAASTAALLFVGLPSALDAGTCSGAVTLRREDAFHNPSSDGNMTVTLASSLPLGVASGPNCSGPPSTASVTFNAGASSSSPFSVTGTKVGLGSVTASARSGTLVATGNVGVIAGPPHHLVFTAAPSTLDAGICSGPVSLEVRDAYDNPTSAPSLVVALKDTPDGGASFYSDQACSAGPVTSVVTSTQTVSFSLLPSDAGDLSVSATGQGLDGGPATRAWVVGP